MKKIILAVILLAAAGGAVYLFTQRNRNIEPLSETSYKETIVGDWKIDSIAANDSNNLGVLIMALDTNLTSYTFSFSKDGAVTQSLNDSIMPVKRSYQWNDSANIILSEGDSASDQQYMKILALTKEQLSLMSADSAVIYFRKKK
ncbi:hypothetical protein [Lacibacter sediminis]|uniref:Lipocalin family protein n=1 Tax=Lacibacter sediminis TaxID=2760713 RepID=A0A7G5XKW7_9BACT|nr:hypothetical protein [Lacibacter sediminis]QNA46120.1 hypothetical protein H4075_08040 [Lacibacter sediminis]